MLWIILSTLCAIAVALIAAPFVMGMRSRTGGDDAALDLARAQLAEIDRDLADGTLGEGEAASARGEIERRVLRETQGGEGAAPQSTRAPLSVLAIALGWVVIGSTALYGFVGRPDLPARPAQTGQAMPAAAAASNPSEPAPVSDMIAGLAQRLKDDPTDVGGWQMLGWSYFQTGDYSRAVDAYQRAVELDDSDATILSVYGEALVRANDGLVDDRAMAVFHRVLAIDPLDPRARFFQGLALEQKGSPEDAVNLWLSILDSAPPDAAWLGELRSRTIALARESGMDISDRLPDAEAATPATATDRGPSAADVAAAQQMTNEDRSQMILGMVQNLSDRLDENPDDAAGWVKLMRSYMVLGRRDDAREALGRARIALAGKADILETLNASAAGLGVE